MGSFGINVKPSFGREKEIEEDKAALVKEKKVLLLVCVRVKKRKWVMRRIFFGDPKKIANSENC